jgi:hypothetical protein
VGASMTRSKGFWKGVVVEGVAKTFPSGIKVSGGNLRRMQRISEQKRRSESRMTTDMIRSMDNV